MPPKLSIPALTVGTFFKRHRGELALTQIGSTEGEGRVIQEPAVNRPGLALSGFFDHFAAKRIQVLGRSELAYLQSLEPGEARRRIALLLDQPIPCVVISRGNPAPEHLFEEATARNIAVFQTPMVTLKFINAATLLLEQDFVPSQLVHGSMVDILGVGTLVHGDSGVGKSECVLELIERGYPLVGDDSIRLQRIENNRLAATSARDNLRNFMEVRGVGIVDVAALFGIKAIRQDKVLDLVVTLQARRGAERLTGLDVDDLDDAEEEEEEAPEPDAAAAAPEAEKEDEEPGETDEIERLGLTRKTVEILGVPVPHIIIPVLIGRDMARLVEVAALDQKLRNSGYNGAQTFIERQQGMIAAS